jgi:hypothetical protein
MTSAVNMMIFLIGEKKINLRYNMIRTFSLELSTRGTLLRRDIFVPKKKNGKSTHQTLIRSSKFE